MISLLEEEKEEGVDGDERGVRAWRRVGRVEKSSYGH